MVHVPEDCTESDAPALPLRFMCALVPGGRRNFLNCRRLPKVGHGLR